MTDIKDKMKEVAMEIGQAETYRALNCPMCNGKVRYQGGGQCWCDNCSALFEETDCIEQMTNEEWFCGLSTDEKAKMLGRVSFCDFCPNQLSEHCAWTTGYSEDCVYGNKESEELWLEWLKEKRT